MWALSSRVWAQSSLPSPENVSKSRASVGHCFGGTRETLVLSLSLLRFSLEFQALRASSCLPSRALSLFFNLCAFSGCGFKGQKGDERASGLSGCVCLSSSTLFFFFVLAVCLLFFSFLFFNVSERAIWKPRAVTSKHDNEKGWESNQQRGKTNKSEGRCSRKPSQKTRDVSLSLPFCSDTRLPLMFHLFCLFSL